MPAAQVATARIELKDERPLIAPELGNLERLLDSRVLGLGQRYLERREGIKYILFPRTGRRLAKERIVDAQADESRLGELG